VRLGSAAEFQRLVRVLGRRLEQDPAHLAYFGEHRRGERPVLRDQLQHQVAGL
jgi:hypothetical protein